MPDSSPRAKGLQDPTLIVIAGPTAVGKSLLSAGLAEIFQIPVISADSRQFYREMKIGTAVPEPSLLQRAPHYLIGHLSIHQDYNVYGYESDVLRLLEDLFRHHAFVILVGGSGLYMNAVLYGIDALPDPDPGLRRHLDQLLEKEGITRLQQMLLGLDPDYYSEVDKKNPKRLQRAIEVCMLTGQPYSALRLNHPKTRPFRAIRIGLEIGRAQLNERINLRVDRMVAEGLVEEVRSLYPYRHLNALNTVGYRELFPYFDGLISLDQAIDQIKRNTRKYAKRQMTWFRKDKQFKWFNPDDTEAIVDYIRNS